MRTPNPLSPREHRDAIAQKATALLGLDGSDNWLNLILSETAAQGVFSNAIDVGKGIGAERCGALRALMLDSDRPEFRKAGIVIKTNAGLMAMVDLWLDPEASADAHALACEPIDLALVVDMATQDVVMLFDTSAWAGYQDAFAQAMALAPAASSDAVPV